MLRQYRPSVLVNTLFLARRGSRDPRIGGAGMTTAGLACGSGVELREGARFCDKCGAAVSAAASAEYKQVTVLFADVVHSMDIAAAVGAERLREIMTELVNRAGVVVALPRHRRQVHRRRHHGAVRGATSARDHALRACLAALDIQAEAGRLAAEVQPRSQSAALLASGPDAVIASCRTR
jgi:adenylate cyclase